MRFLFLAMLYACAATSADHGGPVWPIPDAEARPLGPTLDDDFSRFSVEPPVVDVVASPAPVEPAPVTLAPVTLATAAPAAPATGAKAESQAAALAVASSLGDKQAR